MAKNKIIILMLSLVLIGMLPLGSSAFTEMHEYWTLEGIRTVNGVITNECKDYKAELVDGNNGADTTVLFYFSNNRQNSYVFSHQRGAGYQECLDRAGTDQGLRCSCYGMATHIVQDHFWHTEGGLVPTYLKKYGAANLFGHMTVEKNALDIFLDLKKDSPVVSSGELQFYDDRYLDTFFTEDSSGDLVNTEQIELLNKVAGVDMSNNVRIIQAGYKGEGFYNTVYKDNISLPWWSKAIGWGSIALSLFIIIPVIWLGRNNWKWAIVFLWLIILVVGVIVTISFFNGSTWKITNFVISQPPKVGYLRVAVQDIVDNDAKVQEATNEFLRTGVLPFDDSSGLDYVSSSGKSVEGALPKSESAFKYATLPIIMLLVVVVNVLMFRAAFELGRKRR